MNLRTKQILAPILSIVGAIGTIGTVILTRKAAQQEAQIRKDFGTEMIDEISKKESTKEILKLYIPTFIVGGATIASVLSSTILSRKAEASLTAMALLADQGWRKYKGQVKEKLGLEQHSDILKGIGKKGLKRLKEEEKNDGKRLYFEDHIGFFRAEPEKFALAYSDLNQRLQLEVYGESSYFAILYDLIKACEADILDKNLDIQNLRWGWTADYLGGLYGYIWVHMKMFDSEENGRTFTTIVWQEDPILNPGNYGEDLLYESENIEERSEPCKFVSVIPNKKMKEDDAYEN